MAGGYVHMVRPSEHAPGPSNDQIEALRKMQDQTELRTANSSPNPADPIDPDAYQVRASPFDVAQNHSRCHS